MNIELNNIILLTGDENFKSTIVEEQVLPARENIKQLPNNKEELLQVVVSMNLINSALKLKEYKSKERDAIIHYGMLKPRVSKLLDHILQINLQEFDCDFYIDTADKNPCAYIEIDELQFSFHNISITDNLKAFIDSGKNQPKPWKGVRLQRIAGELFDYIMQKKEA